MGVSYRSLLTVVLGIDRMNLAARTKAIYKVKSFFSELIKQNGIEDIPEEDIEILAENLIDDLSISDIGYN